MKKITLELDPTSENIKFHHLAGGSCPGEAGLCKSEKLHPQFPELGKFYDSIYFETEGFSDTNNYSYLLETISGKTGQGSSPPRVKTEQIFFYVPEKPATPIDCHFERANIFNLYVRLGPWPRFFLLVGLV
ncbi:MAG: hypothetical protein V3R64_07450, partial [Sphingomonadales bacterium]